MAEPAGSKFSYIQVGSVIAAVRRGVGGAHCRASAVLAVPSGRRGATLRALFFPHTRNAADDRLVRRPGPQDLLHPALVGGVFRCRRRRARHGVAARRAGPGDRAVGGRRPGQGQRRQAAAARALPGHPRRPPAQAAVGLRAGAGRLGLHRAATRRSIRSRSTSTPGVAGTLASHARRRLRPGSGQQAGADGGARD